MLVPVCWGGEGSDAPPASTQVAHALSASFWGKGLLVPVCWGRGCSYRSLGGRGLMRPQRPLKLRMRSQHPFGGRGCSYRSVRGEGGLMRPQRPLMLRMRPRHPFGGRGPQVWGKEFYKRGVSSILFLSCSAIILSTQIILQVCDL